MTLPNILTVIRILLTGVLLYVLSLEGQPAALTAIFLFAVAALTDYYDGYFAKKYSLVSDFGKIMDPIADKFLILGSLFMFMGMGIVRPWMVILIAFREVVITGLRLKAMRQGKVMAAEKAGKIKTVLQITAISIILFYNLLTYGEAFLIDPDLQLFWLNSIQLLVLAAVAMTVYSGATYLWNNQKELLDL